MAKKSVTKKKSPKQEHDLFKEVLQDLNKELNVLRIERRKLEESLLGLSKDIGNTQEKEIAMRNRISELMKIEMTLTKKKTNVKDKVAELSKKIEKVNSVSRQLRE